MSGRQRKEQIMKVAAGLFDTRGHQDTSMEAIAQQSRLDDGGLAPRELLLAIMTDPVSLMEIHPGHLRVFFEHFRELPEQVREEIAGKRDRYLRMLVDVLERGVAEGEFRVADPGLTALAVLGMCNWTYQWFRPGGKRDAAEVARYFYGTLLGGIGER
ncbi:TetR/AcrR family transcriptional regulator C-terminal domain-containing protein [Streptomyces sp. NPDC090088]|uniref:TetR/AcrR family transcriptional regulator C-terminal domain-containing protein n=1 Tax=Streptomyces sp. NPDC090088 TaxID=3365944 RepID=UPI00382D911D